MRSRPAAASRASPTRPPGRCSCATRTFDGLAALNPQSSGSAPGGQVTPPAETWFRFSGTMGTHWARIEDRSRRQATESLKPSPLCYGAAKLAEKRGPLCSRSCCLSGLAHDRQCGCPALSGTPAIASPGFCQRPEIVPDWRGLLHLVDIGHRSQQLKRDETARPPIQHRMSIMC